MRIKFYSVLKADDNTAARRLPIKTCDTYILYNIYSMLAS